MTTDYKKLRHSAWKYAMSKYPNSDAAEDFAQYVCLEVLEGRNKHLIYFYVDYMRKQFGRSTEKGLSRKYFGHCAYYSILPRDAEEELRDTDRYSQLLEHIAGPPQDFDLPLELAELRAVLKKLKLRPKKKLVLDLFLKGLSGKQIAKKIGRTESRVSQILAEIHAIIRKKMG